MEDGQAAPEGRPPPLGSPFTPLPAVPTQHWALPG